MRFEETQFAGNTADTVGGGAVFVTSGVRLVLDACTLRYNTALRGDGGAVCAAEDAEVYVIGASQLRTNTAGNHGGALAAKLTTPVQLNESVVVSGNTALHGGGVHHTTNGATAGDFYTTVGVAFLASNVVFDGNVAGATRVSSQRGRQMQLASRGAIDSAHGDEAGIAHIVLENVTIARC